MSVSYKKTICDLWPPSSERVRAWPEVFHWISSNVRIRVAYVLLSFVCEGSAGSVWWTKTKETNVDTADFESASEPAWGKKVKAWVHFILVYDAEFQEFLQGHGSRPAYKLNELLHLSQYLWMSVSLSEIKILNNWVNSNYYNKAILKTITSILIYAQGEKQRNNINVSGPLIKTL